MKLTIKDDQKISVIQEKFNAHYPYLKLEFYSKPHKPEKGSFNRFLKSSSQTIGQCRTIPFSENKELTITPSMTVSTLEQLFYDSYGLSVQVFRKSGKIWLQTTRTDSWTLEKQNSEGEALNKPE